MKTWPGAGAPSKRPGGAGTLPQGGPIPPEDVRSDGVPWKGGAFHGAFLTCREDERLEDRKEGAVSHIHGGALVG